LLAWAVKVAAADGNVDPSERQTLAGFAARRGVPPDQLEQMIGAALHNNLDVPAPRDRDEAQTWLAAMAAVACADGNCSDEEFSLLRALGRTISLSDEDVRLLVKRARTDRYAATSAALRGINSRN
jgi:tellurite resistance protein